MDTLIIIPNQNLFRVANEKTTFAEAFNMADAVLHCGVRGVTDLIVKPGLINLDFADICSVMTEMGKAQMGTGEAEGEKRALDAAEAAMCNPLLQDSSMKGARGVLINITGGLDMTMFEVDDAANRLKKEVDPNANIIVGTAIEDTMEGLMRVSVVATGIEAEAAVSGDNVHLLTDHPRVDNVTEMPAISDRYTPMRRVAPVMAAEIERDSTPESPPALVKSESVSAPAWLAKNKPPFISPRPIETSDLIQAKAEQSKASSFVAAMINGGQERSEPGEGRVNMFRKLTGSRNKIKEVKAAESTESVEAPAPASAPAAESNPPNPQPRLSGMDSVDRMSGSQSDLDLLEIPAFLRRQVN